MQPSLNLILNILVEFHSNPFFQCGLLHCLSEFNNDTTKNPQLLNSLLKVIFIQLAKVMWHFSV